MEDLILKTSEVIETARTIAHTFTIPLSDALRAMQVAQNVKVTKAAAGVKDKVE